MKIVVASMGNEVAGHFGHCENFIFFDTEDGKIVSENSVPNPGHRPGFLPNFLADNGAEVIISGGMGGGARRHFQRTWRRSYRWRDRRIKSSSRKISGRRACFYRFCLS